MSPLWPPTLDLVEWACVGPADPLLELLAHAAPARDVAFELVRYFRPGPQHLDDGPQATAATEAIAETLGQQLAARIGFAVSSRSTPGYLGNFDRKVLAANWAAASGSKPPQMPQSVATPVPTEVDFQEVMGWDTAAVLVSCVGRPMPVRCFTAAELATTRARRLEAPSGEYLWSEACCSGTALLEPTDISYRDALRDIATRLTDSPWDYLRKICLLPKIETQDALLVEAFPTAFIGLSGSWQDSFFFDYCLQTTARLSRDSLATAGAGIPMMLARSALTPTAARRAIGVLERFEVSDAAESHRAEFALEMANLNAQQKDPRALQRAEALVQDGLAACASDSLLAARLTNVLGLVRYRQGLPGEALRLEQLASNLADQAGASAWSGTALLSNIAKLTEVGFGDKAAALEIYLQGAALESELGSVRARLHAARLLLGRREWDRLLCVLEAVPDAHLRSSAEAIYIALLKGVAHLRRGEKLQGLSNILTARAILGRYPENVLRNQLDSFLSSEVVIPIVADGLI